MLSVYHAHLRMGCSSLNAHLCLILHVIDSPKCACGNNLESPGHFFLECPLYAGPRAKLVENVRNITDCNINMLLFGKKNLNFIQKSLIFQSVHEFIKTSKRFDRCWVVGAACCLLVGFVKKKFYYWLT